MENKGKKVIVIGSGLGGISAAISLRNKGYQVEVFEKNEKIGGKLNFISEEGFSFDLGPSILTLPDIFRSLFEQTGRNMDDYIKIQALDPHWRNFFEDGTVVDLWGDREKMHSELRKIGEKHVDEFEKFIAYSGRQYDLVNKGYFKKGLDRTVDFMLNYSPMDFFRMDFWSTMDKAVRKYFSNEHLVNIFDFFIKYVGSSAVDAPGFMNCLPTIQFRYGLWYVPEGMYNIARGFRKYMDEIGIKIHLESEVVSIDTDNGKASGITLKDGQKHTADIVVSNMEVIPAYGKLTGEDARFMKKLEKFEPACSGLVLDIGVDREYPQLNHHNFYFSKKQAGHFDSVFKKKVLPEDPTIYLVAASRTDKSVAPEGCEALKILPHIPYLGAGGNTYTRDDYMKFKERILDKLERMGLEGLREHTVYEHVLTPYDIQEKYYSNKGSVYGVVSDLKKNFAFKAPKRSEKYSNLFFTGGSVNPGGGMPMVMLCGINVAEAVEKSGI